MILMRKSTSSKRSKRSIQRASRMQIERKQRKSGLTYGRVFKQGSDLVQFGYRGTKKVGLFLYSAAKTYNKARYTVKAGTHAYRTYRTFRK